MEHVTQFLQGMELDTKTAGLLTVAACSVGALVLLVQKVHTHWDVEDKIRRARHHRADTLQRAEQAVLQYKNTHPMTNSAFILSLSLSELTNKLQDGSLSPEEVLYCYMEKTLAVNKDLNCCTGILLESFDLVKTVATKKEGLLYGVPVSIKENFSYKNTDTSCGVVIYLDKPAQKDGVLVEVLKRQGAIPFVKTNVPQTMLNYECSNPIYGQTVNPHNLKKTCGGSSGGEGALIGGGGSILGLGSDIAGSVRIPAAFCGICSFKPTAGRLSVNGVTPFYRGQKALHSTPGPMARDVESLALCMQAFLCDHMFSLDATVPPIPFNMQMYQSAEPLRIGYLENDGFSEGSPSMVRGVREVKALLEKAGHTFVPYTPLEIPYAVNELMTRGAFADGITTFFEKMKGDPVDPVIKVQYHVYKLPIWLKKVLSFLIKPVSPRISASLNALTGVRSVAEVWKHNAAVEDYIQATIASWRRYNIDVLLCPMIGPAYNFLYCGKLTSLLSYTGFYNLLNFPAGVVPVSTVTAEDEEELKHYKGNFQDLWDRDFKKAVTGGEGLPIAVQCVALPWRDELCLRFMREVEQVVKQSKK
ncbi:hypothetical protein ABVT39_014068 [Epinephelus coioides]